MLFWFIFIVVLIADQASKALIRAELVLNESIPIIGNVFHLTYIENEGAAFGIFAGNRWFLIIISIIIMLALMGYRSRLTNRPVLFESGAALILSGSIGNLIDRMMKASVTDFFDFMIWPIFNIADIAVTVGVVFLAIHVFISMEE